MVEWTGTDWTGGLLSVHGPWETSPQCSPFSLPSPLALSLLHHAVQHQHLMSESGWYCNVGVSIIYEVLNNLMGPFFSLLFNFPAIPLFQSSPFQHCIPLHIPLFHFTIPVPLISDICISAANILQSPVIISMASPTDLGHFQVFHHLCC